MANTLARQDKRAARTAVIRTRQVARKTTLLLFRCRNVIEQNSGKHQIVAEEGLMHSFRSELSRRVEEPPRPLAGVFHRTHKPMKFESLKAGLRLF
jgi:hypothetical protein